MRISLHDFMAEARIWLRFICSQVSVYTHMTYVLDVRDRMVIYILDNIPLNDGRLVLLDIRYFKD